MGYLAKVIAASLTFSSRRFLTTRIFRGFVGQVNLNTLPAGLNSSDVGRGGTISGFRNGNVGVDVAEGGLARRVGVVRSGSSLVDRNVDIRRRRSGVVRRMRRRRSIVAEELVANLGVGSRSG
jgi:hypothetical protein